MDYEVLSRKMFGLNLVVMSVNHLFQSSLFDWLEIGELVELLSPRAH
jgi:hypothetical protein